MLVREKKKGAEPVHMDFGQGMAALQSGAYEEVMDEASERGPDITGGSVGFQEDVPVAASPEAAKAVPTDAAVKAKAGA